MSNNHAVPREAHTCEPPSGHVVGAKWETRGSALPHGLQVYVPNVSHCAINAQYGSPMHWLSSTEWEGASDSLEPNGAVSMTNFYMNTRLGDHTRKSRI